jgi:hypothetical protein
MARCRALYRLGCVEEAQGEWGAALGAYRAAAAASPIPRLPPDAPPHLPAAVRAAAEAAGDEGRLVHAGALCGAAVAAWAMAPEGPAGRAAAREATWVLREALAVAPAHTGSLMALAAAVAERCVRGRGAGGGTARRLSAAYPSHASGSLVRVAVWGVRRSAIGWRWWRGVVGRGESVGQG